MLSDVYNESLIAKMVNIFKLSTFFILDFWQGLNCAFGFVSDHMSVSKYNRFR